MNAQRNRRKYGLTNPIIFAKVMENPEICRGLIERILPGKKVRELKLIKEDPEDDFSGWAVETEKNISISPEIKSIRLDVLFEGETEWYDIEMQVENRGHLPKRSRYYHALKTAKSLKKGENYSTLKPGYVIFICMFDLFGMGEPMYTFEMCDYEKKGLKLGDGQVTIFLNGTCRKNVPEELRAFYRYLQTGEAGEDDAMVRMIDSAVTAVNELEEVLGKVTLYDEALIWAREAEALKAETAELKAAAEGLKAEAAELKAAADLQKKLTEKLLDEGRVDELKLALKDEKVFQNLVQELKL